MIYSSTNKIGNGDMVIVKGKIDNNDQVYSKYKLEYTAKVLIISQTPNMISTLTDMLKKVLPHSEVENCDSGIAALNLCKKTVYQMIFCDYETKYLSGWKFVKEIKNNNAIHNIPIVLFSTNTELVKQDLTQKTVEINEYGIQSILAFPFNEALLKLAIEKTKQYYENRGGVEFMYTTAKNAMIKNDVKASKKVFQAIHEKTPNLARSNLAMSTVHRAEGNVEKANQFLDKACEADKDNLPARYMQFEVALEKMDFQKTSDIIKDLMKTNLENSTVVLYNLGNILYKHGKYDDVNDLIFNYSQTLHSIPVYLRMLKAKCYLTQGKVEVASDMLNELLEEKYEDVELFNMAAIVAKKLNQLDDAIGHYKNALKKSPGDYRIMFNLALTYAHKSDMDNALTYAKLVLKFEPNFDKAKQLIEKLTSHENNINANKAS